MLSFSSSKFIESDSLKVAGPHRKEMEGSRGEIMPQWLGQGIFDFFQNAFKIISSSGGYNLPSNNSRM